MNYTAFIYYKDINICKITYSESSETDFQYIFEPIYKNIDRLTDFRGIQGIDLSLRKAKYIRKNQMPSFIFERNPLPEKIECQISKKINGMCLLEYLAHLNKHYWGDKLQIKDV